MFGYSESDTDGYDSREPNTIEQDEICPHCGLTMEECIAMLPICSDQL